MVYSRHSVRQIIKSKNHRHPGSRPQPLRRIQRTRTVQRAEADDVADRRVHGEECPRFVSRLKAGNVRGADTHYSETRVAGQRLAEPLHPQALAVGA
ncbi:hypothetical protein D3C75_1011600 [compost metagenome]